MHARSSRSPSLHHRMRKHRASASASSRAAAAADAAARDASCCTAAARRVHDGRWHLLLDARRSRAACVHDDCGLHHRHGGLFRWLLRARVRSPPAVLALAYVGLAASDVSCVCERCVSTAAESGAARPERLPRASSVCRGPLWRCMHAGGTALVNSLSSQAECEGTSQRAHPHRPH